MKPKISMGERRLRLHRRHHLDRSARDAVEAVRGVVALHSSDPLTPHLALRARVPGFRTEDLDRALHEARTLWRLHAMRRTLFVVPTDEGEVFHAAAARDVARRERRKVEGWLGAEMDACDVPGWIGGLESKVTEALADGSERRTQELTSMIPELGSEITVGSGKWTTRVPVSSRILFLMALDGGIVRTRPAGSWRSSQYGWASFPGWFGRELAPLDAADGRTLLARRYLAAFGPATLLDLRWWTGWTAKQAAAAVREIGALPVDLGPGGEGLVLPGDLDSTDDSGDGTGVRASRAAFLPALDPTPMGWKERDWYLGDHVHPLFDRNGNAGPTIWYGGRVVGGWAQLADGEVAYRLLEDVGAEISRLVAEEAAALTSWMDGTVVTPRFRTPLERELSG